VFKLENGHRMQFTRYIEVLRHLTLGEPVVMRRWVDKPNNTDLDVSENRVVFEWDANEDYLILNARISGYEFLDVPGQPAAKLSIGIDAQGVGRRGTHGYYRKTTVRIPYTGLDAVVERMHEAHFGLAYPERPNANEVNTNLQREGDALQLRVVFPRTMFFDHEWDLGSRDSWVGLDMNFTPMSEDGHFHAEDEQVWVRNGISYPNAYGIGVLELTDDDPSPYYRMMLE
jgi:hypothetical protein